jgi:2-polyprenyl-3-methyl-5-hydroxy-6-metoxy-1,4-benzoquinol methylase
MYDARYFDREYFALHPGKHRYHAFLLGLLRAHGVEGGRVLDVGCGFGYFLAALSAAGYRPVGLDHALPAVAAARAQAPGSIVAASLEQGLPFAESAFEAVTLFDVIEHLEDCGAALRRCREVLAPEGRLFVLTLNALSLARPLLGRSWSWHLDPTHRHLFSARSLRRALSQAGFQPLRVSTVFDFCRVGEGNPALRPLRRLGRVVKVPIFGDSLLAVARR